MSQPYLQIDRISKAFPGVQALAEVSLDVNKGDIHAVAGENGAGKSTLMKILAGMYPHGTFGGDFRLDGASCHFRAITEAEAAGIVMIPQELAVVNELSIAENMFVNAWPGSLGIVAWSELYGKAHEMMGKLGLDVDPQMPIKKLGAAKKQLVLIAKALLKNVKLLILDEPTSSLSDAEREILFDHLRKLKEHGVTSLYISHKLDEIIAISDRVTVLRDGRLVDTRNTKEITPAEIVRRMVGRPITQMYPREQRVPGDLALRVESLTLYHPDLRDMRVVDRASLSVRAREIVGIYGLMGSGRTELMQGMFGAWAGKSELETYEIDGRPVKISSPRQAMNYGIGFLTEDRKRSGIIEGKDLKTNITVTCLKKVSHGQILDHRRERILAEELVRVLKVRTPSVDANIGNLSGATSRKF